MKKKTMTVALICAIMASMSMQSCIGSYALFNKLLAWNNTIDNKFINEVVFFAFWFLPAYEVALVADTLVLNTIEFWSGTSPLASSSKIIEGNDGKYLVEQDSDGYTITSLNDNVSLRLNFDAATQTWSAQDAEGHDYMLMTFVDDTHIMVPAPDGGTMVIEKSQDGLMAYKQAVEGSCFALR